MMFLLRKMNRLVRDLRIENAQLHVDNARLSLEKRLLESAYNEIRATREREMRDEPGVPLHVVPS